MKEGGADVRREARAGTVPEEVAKASHYKLDQAAPIADPLELDQMNGIIFGVPPLRGHMGLPDLRTS